MDVGNSFSTRNGWFNRWKTRKDVKFKRAHKENKTQLMFQLLGIGFNPIARTPAVLIGIKT